MQIINQILYSFVKILLDQLYSYALDLRLNSRRTIDFIHLFLYTCVHTYNHLKTIGLRELIVFPAYIKISVNNFKILVPVYFLLIFYHFTINFHLLLINTSSECIIILLYHLFKTYIKEMSVIEFLEGTEFFYILLFMYWKFQSCKW